MNNLNIVKLSELDNEFKEKAVHLFVDSFYNMYTSLTKDNNVLYELFLYSLDFSLVYVALYDNIIAGFMGIANNKKRTMHFDRLKCIDLFGRVKGIIIYKQLGFILEKPNVKNDNEMCIDYLATDRSYRGKGIATKLIDYACNELGYDECYLEVLTKNITAKRLYEHTGFKEYKRCYSIGLGNISKMKKQLVCE
jgi:ribosomal protein S18 acetylase RimI-like enzyme